MAMVKLFRVETKREMIAPGVYGPVEHLHVIGHFSIPKGHELAHKEHKPKGKKGESYQIRGATITDIGSCQLEPLAICNAELLPHLRPEDFTAVVLIGDYLTPGRWVHEAIRVGSRGITMLCGVAPNS